MQAERGPIVHDLKCWPEYFAAVRDGFKPFEVRKNDRDFRVGDTLRLWEFDPKLGIHTGIYFQRRVTYALPGGSFGVDPDHIVMGLSTMRDTQIIDLEPIVSAPTDGRTMEAILGNAPNTLEIVRFDAGHWSVYRGTVPSPTGAARPMSVWHALPEGVYPTHYIKGTVGKHDCPASDQAQGGSDGSV